MRTDRRKTGRRRDTQSEANKICAEDLGAHNWYRFVLSFPPHLVRDYLERFGMTENRRVLDPFCGTGTTLVESKKLGIPSVGIEANSMAHFAARVKVDWSSLPQGLAAHSCQVARAVQDQLDKEAGNGAFASEMNRLPDESAAILLTDSISPLPLHKILSLRKEIMRQRATVFRDHELLALAKTAVGVASNLRFGPEVGVGTIKTDAPVVEAWARQVEAMAADLEELHQKAPVPAEVFHADARKIQNLLAPKSIDTVFTSPPYPNEKDYTRTTRLESVLLNFVLDKAQLRELKKTLLRSNTRGVYKGDDDDQWVAHFPAIQEIAEAIESRRIALGKTSGFERMYPRVTKLYFGGMARHLSELRPLLRPGAHLAYVVGDQASYLQVMIRTGELLAKIAELLGYEVVGIDLFRTRMATATKAQLREEVVVLRWMEPPNDPAAKSLGRERSPSG